MSFDHVAKARSRIIAEYRNKPAFVEWIKINPEIAQTSIEAAAETLIESYDVDVVTGELLNIIGRIVGIPRPIIRFTDFQVFGYLNNPSYANYNVAPYIGDPADVVKDQPMSDFLYRKLVKAKISRNISTGTYDEIVSLATYITGVQVVVLVDGQDMTFSLGFGTELDVNTQFLVDNFDIIPKPQGVTMNPSFVLPDNIDEIERTSNLIFQYSNYTLPGDVL